MVEPLTQRKTALNPCKSTLTTDLERENEKWNEEKSCLQNTIHQLEEELHLLKNKCPKLCVPKRQLQFSPQASPQKTPFNSPQKLYNRIRDLKEEQRELKDNANAEKLNLERELITQKKKYDTLIKDLTQAKTTLINDKNRSDKLIQKLRGKVSSLEECEKKTILLTSELNREKYEKNKLQIELEDVKKKKGELYAQNIRLKDQVKDLSNSKKMDEKKDLKSETSPKKVIFQKERYDSLIANLTEEKNILSRHKQHAEELINSLNMRLIKLEGYEKVADSLSATLETEQMEKQKLKLDLENLLEKKQELESFTIRLKDELKQLADIMERRNKLDSQSWTEKDQLLKQLILEKNKSDSISRELKTLRESIKIEKDLGLQVAEMNAKLSLSLSLDSPKKQAEEKENINPGVNMDLINYENRAKDLQRECELLQKDKQKLEIELQKLIADRQETCNEVVQPQKQTKITNVTEKLNRLRLECDNLKLKLEKSEADKASMKEELLKLVQEAEKRVADFKTKIDSQESEINKLSDQLRRRESISRSVNRNFVKEIQKEFENMRQQHETVKYEKDPSLQLQITRLEKQLEKSQESSILNREMATNAKNELASKEKELSNLKIDVRILQRELNDEKQAIKRLREDKSKLTERHIAEREKLETALSEEKELSKQAQRKVLELEAHLTSEKDKYELKINVLNRRIEQLKSISDSLNSLKSDAAIMKNKVNELEKELQTSNEDKNNIQSKFSTLNEQIKAYQTEKIFLEDEVMKWKNRCSCLEESVKSLQETCLLLDEQVVKSETYIQKLEQQLDDLHKESGIMEEKLNAIREELRLAKISVNEEKSLRTFSESKHRELLEKITSYEKEIKSIKDELCEKDANLTSAVQKLSVQEEQSAILKNNFQNCKEHINYMEKDINSLKAERTDLLTRLHLIGEENGKLHAELEEATNDLNALQNVIGQLQSTVTQLEAYHEERHLKSNTTLQQHTKLIDLLQTKMLEAAKKKRTFADMLLFKSKVKETLDPKELGHLLQVERMKSKGLAEQLYQVQAELMLLRGDQITAKLMSPPKFSHNSKIEPKLADDLVLADIANSPNLLEKHIMARIKHNIPHKFEVKLCTKSDQKCCECQEYLQFGRRISQCSECRLCAHVPCSTKLPPICGLPEGYFEQFVNLNKQSDAQSSSIAQRNEKGKMDGWIKVLRDNKCWEQLFAKIANNELLLYDSVNTSTNDEPTLRLNLKTVTAIIEHVDVFTPYLNNVTQADLPLIIGLQRGNVQKPLYIMTKSTEEKVNWMNVLKPILDTEVEMETVSMVSNGEGRICILNGADYSVKINCIVQLSSEVCVIGGEEGLFSLRLNIENRTSQTTLVSLSDGVSNVEKIKLLPKLRIAIVICDMLETGCLMKCDLRLLLANAEAAECSEPRIKLERAIPKNFNNCYMLATSLCNTGLAVATKNGTISIYEWNQYKVEFCIKHQIDAKNVAAMVFTPTNLLYSTSHGLLRFDFSELKTAKIKDNFRYGTDKNYPTSILKITDNEYLICNDTFGYFVDAFGKQLKWDTVKWYHTARNIVYNNPFIFVTHDICISMIYMNGRENNCLDKDYKLSVIEFDNPVIIGLSKHIQGGIFVQTSKKEDNNLCRNVVLFDGVEFVKQNPKLSWSSVSIHSNNLSEDRITAELNISSTDISVTSSLLNSGSEDDVTQIERKVRFATNTEEFEHCHSSLYSICSEID